MVLAVLVVASYYLKGLNFARAVFLGGILVMLNLYHIDWTLKRMFKDKSGRFKKDIEFNSKFFLEGAIKIFVSLVFVLVVLLYFELNKVAFLIGVSVFFISLLFRMIV